MGTSNQNSWLIRSRSCISDLVAFLHHWLWLLRFWVRCWSWENSLIGLHSAFVFRFSLNLGLFSRVRSFCFIFRLRSLNFSNFSLLRSILLNLRLSLVGFLLFLGLFFLLFFWNLLGSICLSLNSRLSVSLWLLLWFLAGNDNFDLSLSVGTILGCNCLLFFQLLDLKFLSLRLWSFFNLFLFLFRSLISCLICVVLFGLQILLNILKDVFLRNLGGVIIDLNGRFSFWSFIIMDLNKYEISLSNTLWGCFFLFFSLHSNNFFSIFSCLFICFLLF